MLKNRVDRLVTILKDAGLDALVLTPVPALPT